MSFNAKRSYTEYNVTSSTAVFPIGFADYNQPKKDRIIVTVDGVLATEAGYAVVRSSSSTITLSPAVSSGVVRLTRETNIDDTFYIFTAGALFTPKNVAANFEQILRSQQEVSDRQQGVEDKVLPLVAGLEDALALAEEASTAAANAATAASEAAAAAEAAAAETQFYLRYYTLGVVYPPNARIQLANGDTVQNISGGNLTNDPNTDPTGWLNVSVANGIKYANGYTVQAALYYLTPEMFGAVGDGVHDDCANIQTMLNMGVAGCVFEFDGSKTYYNGFGIDDPNVFVDHKEAAINSKQWTRRLGATFKFNGCRLTRRKPTGDIEDIPNKTKYSDNDSSGLLVVGATKVIVEDLYVDGAGDKRGLIDLSSNPIADSTDYYGADVGVFGIRLWQCNDVVLRNVVAEKAYFPIFLDQCTNVRGDVQVRYSVQCPIRSYAPTDLNFGGGLKIWFSTNVKLEVHGEYNTNATVECEKGNTDLRIRGSSLNDWSNGMVIQDTIDISIDWLSDGVKSGTGVYIKRTGEAATPNMNNIRGKIHSKRCYWRGVLIENGSAATSDLYGIDLDVVTENCGDGGLFIVNNSTTSLIDGIKINHYSKNDNGTNKARCFVGRMRGVITGTQVGTDYGAIIQGTNTNTTCITLSIDASNVTVPYTCANTAYVNLVNFMTSTDVITACANRNMQLGTTRQNGTYNNNGEIRLNHFAVKVTAQYNVLENLANSSGNERLRLFYDTTTGVDVTGGKNYTCKVYIPN